LTCRRRHWHKFAVKLIFLIVPLLALAMVAAVMAPLMLPASVAVAKNAAAPVHPGASGLSIPRFVSLSSDTVNMRAGPGVRYPITWVYRRKGTPLMVMAEFEYWRKVRDGDGTEGWMHRSLLSGRRMALLRGGISELRQSPKAGAPVALRAEAGVIGRLLACRDDWCQVDLNDAKAWLPRARFFGALPNEEF
jgi:SH3-like domain-containing protein